MLSQEPKHSSSHDLKTGLEKSLWKWYKIVTIVQWLKMKPLCYFQIKLKIFSPNSPSVPHLRTGKQLFANDTKLWPLCNIKNETTVLFSNQAELTPTNALMFLVSWLKNSFFAYDTKLWPLCNSLKWDHCAIFKSSWICSHKSLIVPHLRTGKKFLPMIQNCDHCAMIKNEPTVLFSIRVPC